MSGIIKAGTSDRAVQAFVGTRIADHSRPIEVRHQRSAVELALSEAHDEIGRLQAALLAAERDAVAREAAARRAGRQQGAQEAADASAMRLELLGEAMATAQAVWSEALARLDTLAATVAREALAGIFMPSGDLAELTARAITRKMAKLQTDAVVAVSVSAADFPDAAAIGSLRARIGGACRTIDGDPALDRGQARISLQLGHVDLGPVPQWRALDRFLRQLSDGDGGGDGDGEGAP